MMTPCRRPASRLSPSRPSHCGEPSQVTRASSSWCFSGVYTAFMLDGCRERQKSDQLRTQILDSLRLDMKETAQGLDQLQTWFHEQLDEPTLQRLERSETPNLTPIPLPSTAPQSSWSEVLASGGLQVLDLELIQKVEHTLLLVQQMGLTAEQYNNYVRTVLVPNLGQDQTEFYNPETGRLRPKYLWYQYSLAGYRDALGLLKKETADLISTLEPSAP